MYLLLKLGGSGRTEWEIFDQHMLQSKTVGSVKKLKLAHGIVGYKSKKFSQVIIDLSLTTSIDSFGEI